ncbi:acyltransferase family protein [Erythrobacter tepidarius]|uniref:acyltransferase family protein n=1 Tax=Erythrobacter tepidarius TaxID=60454 RepID=UPI0013027F5D|nr:acyltransferase family protein [Erythrobacter tepidarius]
MASPDAGYRPDIQGLRAVAVLAVLLFHLGLDGFSGGFVGVDVFYVISGYLIGGIVLREHEAGRFSLAHFYARRVRRLVPALLVVLAASTLAAMLLLLPAELANYAETLLAALVFAANIHFYRAQFEYSESGEVPLLHLWTLGVEWQFYLLLPLLMLALLRFGRAGLWFGLVGVAVLSAACSLAYPEASFYLLPARVWEFLAGVLTAITTVPLLRLRVLREILALSGLLLIAAAIVLLDTADPFPGWRALIPCAGAAAIVLAGKAGPSLTGRALSLPGMTWLGAISYSLYLWHWPVIVFLLLGLPAPRLDWPLQLAATAISVVLATLSARFVEAPARQRTVPFARLALISGGVAAVLAASAAMLLASGGWPGRFSQRSNDLARALDYPIDQVFRTGSCFIHHKSQQLDEAACLLPDDGRPRVLVLGDSHAAMLVPGLQAAFPGSAVSQLTVAGCRPVTGARAERYFFCHRLIEDAYKRRIAAGNYDLLVLAGYWEEGDLAPLEASLALLAERKQAVLLVGPFPAFEKFVPRLLAIGAARGNPRIADAFLKPDRALLDQRMAALAARYAAHYFSPLRQLCDPQCRYLGAHGDPLIIDDAHLTAEGSRLVAEAMAAPGLMK